MQLAKTVLVSLKNAKNIDALYDQRAWSVGGASWRKKDLSLSVCTLRHKQQTHPVFVPIWNFLLIIKELSAKINVDSGIYILMALMQNPLSRYHLTNSGCTWG